MCTSSTTQQCACGPCKMLFEEHEWSGRDVTQDVAHGASLDWQGKDLISLTSYITYKWRINHLSTCHVNEAHIQRIVIAVSTTTPIRIVGDDFGRSRGGGNRRVRGTTICNNSPRVFRLRTDGWQCAIPSLQILRYVVDPC
jgi:hypothetical protein